MASLLHKNLFLKQIIAWDGTIASIPNGWALCDGTNGTPDLRDKFVRGAPNATEEGGTGGADTVALVTANMPAHTHVISGTHFHQYGQSSNKINRTGATTQISGSSTMAAASVGNTGSGTAHENKPKFYAVVFIQRVT